MQNAFLYIASVITWGLTWYAIKFQLDIVHPSLSVSYRFFIASFVLYVFCVFTGRHKHKFTKNQYAFIALQGFFLFCFNYWLTYQSTFYLTSGIVALCFSTMTIMNIFGQYLFFKLPFNKKVVGGAAMGLFGIALVFYPEISTLDLSDKAVLGGLLCLLGTSSASLGNMVSYRNTRQNMPVILTSTYAMFFGACLTFTIAILFGAPITFDSSYHYIASLLFLAIFGSAVAFTCYLTLLSRIGADKAGYVAVIVPIVALAISTAFENYHWNIWSISGSVLILIGNVIAMTDKNAFRYLKLRPNWQLFKKNTP